MTGASINVSTCTGSCFCLEAVYQAFYLLQGQESEEQCLQDVLRLKTHAVYVWG